VSGPERRRSPRYPCAADLEIGWGSEILRASVSDICTTGMFIETVNPLWIRAEFSARVLFPDPLDVNCVVKRVEPGRGMAVEFTEIPEASREALEGLIWKLAGG
jgi:hypothetical protein